MLCFSVTFTDLCEFAMFLKKKTYGENTPNSEPALRTRPSPTGVKIPKMGTRGSKNSHVPVPQKRGALSQKTLFYLCQENWISRAHKNKIGTPPPPKNEKNQNTHGFSCRTDAFFQVSIKLAQLRTKSLRTRGFFWLWSPVETWGLLLTPRALVWGTEKWEFLDPEGEEGGRGEEEGWETLRGGNKGRGGRRGGGGRPPFPCPFPVFLVSLPPFPLSFLRGRGREGKGKGQRGGGGGGKGKGKTLFLLFPIFGDFDPAGGRCVHEAGSELGAFSLPINFQKHCKENSRKAVNVTKSMAGFCQGKKKNT